MLNLSYHSNSGIPMAISEDKPTGPLNSASADADRPRSPIQDNVRASDSYEPANDIERRLIEIWERSFQRSPISVEETFSESGG